MRLNLGCGKQVLGGWTNVDIAKNPKAARAPEVLADLRSIPLPDACADEAMAIHVIEHFYRWEVPGVLAEWKRLLKPGGLLILELPDLMKCAKSLVAGGTEQKSYWGLYGDPSHEDPYMTHRWGWTEYTLTEELRKAGFVSIKTAIPEFHRKSRFDRDMRLEARKA